MTGRRVFDRLGLRIDDRDAAGRERFAASERDAIGALEHAGRIGVLDREGGDRRAQPGGRRGGFDAVTRHVADRDREPAVRQREDVVPVAADERGRLRRQIDAVDGHARHLGEHVARRELLQDARHALLRAALIVDVGVGAEPADHAAVAVAQRKRARQEPPVPVGAAQPELHIERLARGDGVGPAPHDFQEVVRVMHALPAPAEGLLARLARVLVPAVVVPVDRTGRVGRPDELRHRREERLEAPLHRARLGLGADALVDVERDAVEADDRSGVVPARQRVTIERPKRAVGAQEAQLRRVVAGPGERVL